MSGAAPVPDPQSITLANPDMEWRMTRHGPLLYFRHDAYIGASLREYGEFSEQEFDLLRQLLAPGDTVVEVGANIGALTVPLARCLLPGGRLIAIEAQRRVFQVLCANLVLNGLPHVQAMHAAGSAQAGYLRVPEVDYAAPNNFGGISVAPEHAARGGELVQPVAIDDLELAACKLIKVDVEGMELDVLKSASQTLRRLRPLLYVENDRQRDSPALIDYIASHGYRLWWHQPALFNPANHAGNARNDFEHLVSLNMLCVPREIAFDFRNGREVSGPQDFPAVGGTDR